MGEKIPRSSALRLLRLKYPKRVHAFNVGQRHTSVVWSMTRTGLCLIAPAMAGENSVKRGQDTHVRVWLSAGAALDPRSLPRDDDGGSAHAAARVRLAQSAAHGDDSGQPYAAVDTGIGCAGRIRRSQTAGVTPDLPSRRLRTRLDGRRQFG